mmetsp:Transcript_15012/g.38584  ORF Transcript_15012/g.38584 Transcript_15012/m.38584 type:complete len:203 (-) Transcript_15012:181-789(-)
MPIRACVTWRLSGRPPDRCASVPPPSSTLMATWSPRPASRTSARRRPGAWQARPQRRSPRRTHASTVRFASCAGTAGTSSCATTVPPPTTQPAWVSAPAFWSKRGVSAALATAVLAATAQPKRLVACYSGAMRARTHTARTASQTPRRSTVARSVQKLLGSPSVALCATSPATLRAPSLRRRSGSRGLASRPLPFQRTATRP